MSKLNIAVFASGTGTNAENIFRYFQGHDFIEVKLLLCNKPDALVIEKAKRFNIPVHIINRSEWGQPQSLLSLLQQQEIGLIVLAGFLWLIPAELVSHYPKRIINIHPALLPKYGGKGMYGAKVHEAVKAAAEMQTGISIHYVDSNYDEGELIFQTVCPIDPQTETAEQIAQKVHKLEYRYFPVVIEEVAAALHKQSELK